MQKFMDQFYLNFIKDNRWKYLTDGLKTTLLITFFGGDSGYCAWFSRGNCPFQRRKKRNQEAGKDEREGRIYQKAAGVLSL